MGQGASIGGVEVEKPEGLSIEDVTNGNVALVFVKPHACNEAMVQFVKEELVKKKLVILGETPLGAEAIVEGDFVDRHYAGICGAAMKSGAAELSVADDKKAAFAEKFAAALEGKSYDDAVGAGLVLNCVEAMAKLGGDEPMSAKDLFAKWNLAEAQGAKLAPGTYVRLVEGGEADDDGNVSPPVFVVNGFYPAMREKYVEEDAGVHLFVVGFKPDDLSWASFRSDVIGATNPASAADGSIRALAKAKFGELGLKEEPNNTDNCVHASAGPLEAIKERSVWLGWTLQQDPTGHKMLEACLDKEAPILELLGDCKIEMYGLGGAKTAFDLTEERDTKEAYVLANNYAFKDELAEYIK